jgi:hypothetical protein
MHITRKLAIPTLTVAALMGAGGIAYANTVPTPTPTPPIVSPSPSPTISPLPSGCYTATDYQTITARRHTPVYEITRAIVCNTPNGPVVYVDTQPNPGFPRH